jgi:hypothetical protein
LAAWNLALFLQTAPPDIGKLADRYGVAWVILGLFALAGFREYRVFLTKLSAIVSEISANAKADTETHAMLKDLSKDVTQIKIDMARILEHTRK